MDNPLIDGILGNRLLIIFSSHQLTPRRQLHTAKLVVYRVEKTRHRVIVLAYYVRL
ncbi:MAG: hypothetical protein ACI9LY_001078 [Arenicella sp.]|jgi:hypothetical protein